MSAYRIKPGAIPKHLKPPKQTPRPAGSRPPIRGAKESDAPIKTGWFGLPRRQPAAKGWLARENRRNIAREHPHARLRDPTGLRIYNFVVKASVPALVLYFLFFAQAGEQSDIAIIRRWSEGLQQDIKDWWNNVPKDKEVDPEVLLRMSRLADLQELKEARSAKQSPQPT